jgi:shikimate kinase
MSEIKGLSTLGMPASGKTTIAEGIAAELAFPYTSMDEWMEAQERMSTAQIAAQQGDEYVIDLEARCVYDLDQRPGPEIFSPSGSVIYTDDIKRGPVTVRDTLRAKTLVVLLQPPLEVIRQRLMARDTSRKIIGLDPAKPGDLERLEAERMPRYLYWAHAVIEYSENDTVPDVRDRVIGIYRQFVPEAFGGK